jgi:homospermidine synthase
MHGEIAHTVYADDPCPAGRLAYFYSTTSPLTLLASTSQLEQAQQDVQHYEGLIKEAGVKGCYVPEQDKERYWNARQRKFTASSAGI